MKNKNAKYGTKQIFRIPNSALRIPHSALEW